MMRLIPRRQYGGDIRLDAIKSYKPKIKLEPIKRQYTIVDLKGSPAEDISYELRWARQKGERRVEDVKLLVGGLNKTFGTAAALASIVGGGGWAATRLLSGNKATQVGRGLSQLVLPSNAADNVGDAVDFISNPTASKALELGVGVGLGRWKNFGNKYRQSAEIGNLFINSYNVSNTNKE